MQEEMRHVDVVLVHKRIAMRIIIGTGMVVYEVVFISLISITAKLRKELILRKMVELLLVFVAMEDSKIRYEQHVEVVCVVHIIFLKV